MMSSGKSSISFFIYEKGHINFRMVAIGNIMDDSLKLNKYLPCEIQLIDSEIIVEEDSILLTGICLLIRVHLCNQNNTLLVAKSTFQKNLPFVSQSRRMHLFQGHRDNGLMNLD